MRYGSVCSGIEAPTAKRCSACHAEKPLADFHRQPGGKYGRHSYCKPCANERQKRSRTKNYTPEQKRRWQLKTRYGLTPAAYDALLAKQGGRCAVCGEPPARPCVDHDHATGAVRGVLCHRCNIGIAILDDDARLTRALAYLGRRA